MRNQVFFTQVIIPEIFHGTVKKQTENEQENQSMQKQTFITSLDVVGDNTILICGVCGKECSEEPDVDRQMSIGCDM